MPSGRILDVPTDIEQKANTPASSAQWWSLRQFLTTEEYEEKTKSSTELALEKLQQSSEFARFRSNPSKKFKEEDISESDGTAEERFVEAYFAQKEDRVGRFEFTCCIHCELDNVFLPNMQTEESEAAREMDCILFSYFDLDQDGTISSADLRAAADMLNLVCVRFAYRS